MFLITCITGRDKKIGKVRTRSEWFDRAAVGRHVVAWSTKCGLKRGLAIFFFNYFFLLLWSYLYHTISIRDLKIELFKVIFHRGQLPCSGLNQRTKENVIAKGRLFKVYHSNSKGCQNFGWENWCNIR